MDAAAVDRHADDVVAATGRLDISFTAISDNDVQGTAMAEMDVDDYLAPVITNVRSKFITARAAARHMKPQGGGVLLYFGGAPNRAPFTDYYIGGVLTALRGGRGDAPTAVQRTGSPRHPGGHPTDGRHRRVAAGRLRGSRRDRRGLR